MQKKTMLVICCPFCGMGRHPILWTYTNLGGTRLTVKLIALELVDGVGLEGPLEE